MQHFISRTTKILFLAAVIIMPIRAFTKEKSIFKEGDLLFQDMDCGELCDAIGEVTKGYHDVKLSHVGLVVKDSLGELCVIEAVSKGVVYTSIDNCLARSKGAKNPKVFIGRLKSKYSHLIPMACSAAKEYLGRPYDDLYLMDNDSIYCSELIYYAFKQANSGKDFFELKKMTFKSPKTHDYFAPWVEYYAKFNRPVPEGELGINPGDLSLSDKLKIIEVK